VDIGTKASVVRWRRYGKDRLYVTGADGVKLGWRDLLSGGDHVETAERVSEYVTAVVAWLASDDAPLTLRAGLAPAVPGQRSAPGQPAAGVVPESPVAVEPEPRVIADPAPTLGTDAPAEPTSEDLATRRAGAMAREKATSLKQAAPVRTLFTRALGIHTEERAWRIGADGEQMVAAQLARLAGKDPRWRFLNAVPIGENGSDIDHVVVGPGGVYTLNAKHHPGGSVWVGGNTFMVNGQRHPYIRNSRHEAERASRLLTSACGFPVVATAVVVPVGAADFTVKEPPKDVYVVNRMALRDWLRRRPVTLTDEQIDAVYAVARRSTTWQPPPG
jgi:hypothetical protein